MASSNVSSNRPSHEVFMVEEGRKEGDKGFWTRIGAAWEHNDGKGFNVQLQATPVNGKLVIRKLEPKAG